MNIYDKMQTLFLINKRMTYEKSYPITMSVDNILSPINNCLENYFQTTSVVTQAKKKSKKLILFK